MTRKKKKEGLKWRTIQVKVPVCPKCGANMKEHNGGYLCEHCTYKHVN